MLSRHSVGTYQGNELTHNLSGNTWPQSSQLAEPLWTDPGVKSGITERKVISTLKKKKRKNKTQAWNEYLNLPQKSSQQGKSHHIVQTLSDVFLDSRFSGWS